LYRARERHNEGSEKDMGRAKMSNSNLVRNYSRALSRDTVCLHVATSGWDSIVPRDLRLEREEKKKKKDGFW
jgi:hypothetical protein